VPVISKVAISDQRHDGITSWHSRQVEVLARLAFHCRNLGTKHFASRRVHDDVRPRVGSGDEEGVLDGVQQVPGQVATDDDLIVSLLMPLNLRMGTQIVAEPIQANTDLDYGAAVTAIAIEAVARAATENPGGIPT
jgi:hypothetical protein